MNENEAERLDVLERQTQKIAVKISRRSPVSPGPIYRALLLHSAENVEAAIAQACTEGADPNSFSNYLEEKVATAPAGIESVAGDLHAPVLPKRRLPPHIERAARAAWRAGYVAAEYDRRHPGEKGLDDDAGLDVFLCSLQQDADRAQRAT